MPTPPRVPADLLGCPFTLADAEQHRVSRRMLQSRNWRRVLTGVYVSAATPDSPQLRQDALRLVLPDGAAAAGLTAAWVHGLWTPPSWRPAPLVRTRVRGGSRMRRLDVVGRRQVLEGDLVEVDGLLVTSVLRTAFDLIRDVPLVEAVTVVDAITSAESGPYTLDLRDYIERHPRWPGVNRARIAVRLSSSRVRSPGESRLRMAVVLPGLPEPLVNPPLHLDTPAGTVVRYPDLLVDTRRPTLLEYDGAYHDEDEQPDDDAERENLFSSTGLPVLRYRKRQLRAGLERTVAEIARTCQVQPTYPIDHRDFALPRHRPPW